MCISKMKNPLKFETTENELASAPVKRLSIIRLWRYNFLRTFTEYILYNFTSLSWLNHLKLKQLILNSRMQGFRSLGYLSLFCFFCQVVALECHLLASL